MGTKDTLGELMKAVSDAWREYAELADRHAQLFADAHSKAHGSEAMMQTLHYANEAGPQMMMALRRYLDALEILTAFYESATGANHKHVHLPKQKLRLAS